MDGPVDEIVERWCVALREVEILEPWITESHRDDHYWHDVADLVVARAGQRPDHEVATQALRSALSETFVDTALVSNNGLYRDRLDERLEAVVRRALSGTCPVEFEYRLAGRGWVDARLRVGDQTAALTASDIGDALSELLDGALLLAHGEPQVRIRWDEEPGEFRWVIDSIGEHCNMLILWFDDQMPERSDSIGAPVLSAMCERTELLKCLSRTARGVLEELGEDGYRKAWSFPFPLEQLVELEQWLSRE